MSNPNKKYKNWKYNSNPVSLLFYYSNSALKIYSRFLGAHMKDGKDKI